MDSNRRLGVVLCVVYGLWFLAAYLPDLGRGFIRDDFAWVNDSRVSSIEDVVRFFHSARGFYRPVVSLSFAADRTLFGLAPLPYALTNLLLILLCGGAIYLLARALRLTPETGALAALIWMLNPHGVNTTLLWISGRTALLLTLFAVLAAAAFKRRRVWLAGLMTLVAMLSKEEAVLLPIVFFAWAFLDGADGTESGTIAARMKRATLASSPAFLALAIYIALRSGSGAMTHVTAPAFYRFTADPRRILRNIGEYSDRTLTFAAGMVLLSGALGRSIRPAFRVERRLVGELSIWLIGLFSITVFLPLRSGLYVLAPSVAVGVLAAESIRKSVEGLDLKRARLVVTGSCAAALIAVPIYWVRNEPDVRRAELTSRVLREVVPRARELPGGSVVVIRDDRGSGATLEGGFGALATDALETYSGRTDVSVWLDPPPFDLRGLPRPDGGRVKMVFRLHDGLLEQER